MPDYESVDPSRIPARTLRSGAQMPGIGLGTFGSDRYSPAQIADAVEEAIRSGYRHIDCASVYGNEKEVGGAIQRSGVPRDRLWITSKVWNDKHDQAEASCEQSLRDLQLDYLDLYLIHWPFPNHHAVGVDVSSRDPHAVPYSHEHYMSVWRQLENLVRRGLVREIGTSNMTISKLRPLLEEAEIKPSANEMELHPHFQQPKLFDFVTKSGMVPIGYSPLGSPSRPERDRTPDDTSDTEDPVVLRIAEGRGISATAVCVKWAVQRGQVPIPFSVKRDQYMASLRAAASDPLTDQEMAQMAGIDKGCRLIKGQVFLWPGADSWEALWE
ncbi:MAG TPA: aldo/keto reductase [Fimbriimonas sp.]|nr:aldo/keto reductase [Fimbriimonas sp.]